MNNADCDTPACAHFHINASGMEPSTRYQVDCYSSVGGRFDTGTSYVSSGPGGNIDQDTSCYFGYPGATVWATLNGIESNRSTW